MQFIMVDKQLLTTELSSDEILAYSLICDRMKSSRRQSNFYDYVEKDYYVIFTQKEMAKTLKISIRKANSIFKHFVKLGLLRAKKQFSRASKLFIPNTSEERESRHANSAYPKTQNLHSNQTNYNQKNKSKIYTVNTKKTNSKIDPIEIWQQAVIGKVGLTSEVSETILKQVNYDLKKAYQLIGIIKNSRNSVMRDHHLKPSSTTRFETNVNIKQKLATKLSYIFNYLPKNLTEQAKYMTKCLKTFFLEAFGLRKDKMVRPNYNRSNSQVNIKQPEWMKQKYDPNANPLKESTKRRFEEQLKALKDLKPLN